MPLKTQRDEMPTLNLAPMIDVVFLLLIFFLVGTKFSEWERKIQLRIPEVARNPMLTAAPERQVVNVYRDGSIMLNDQQVTLEELTARLRQQTSRAPGTGVVVRSDRQGAFQNVAEVFNACKLAGVRNLGVSVRMNSAAP